MPARWGRSSGPHDPAGKLGGHGVSSFAPRTRTHSSNPQPRPASFLHEERLIIDPRNDFCDPRGSLCIPGADRDMARLAALIEDAGGALSGIEVPLNSHAEMDRSHPGWWRDASGRPPAPLCRVSASDRRSGRLKATRAGDTETGLAYLETPERGQRFPHTIWPAHCLTDTWGYGIYPALDGALTAWENDQRRVRELRKDQNPSTEHFSAVRAEVPALGEPGTQIHPPLVDRLERADLPLVAGEASTHCVRHTIARLFHRFRNPTSARKPLWLTDASSPFPDPPGTQLFSAVLTGQLSTLRKAGMGRASVAEIGARLRAMG